MESIDVSPPETFIAYNIGVFESGQKFGGLITSGKITNLALACRNDIFTHKYNVKPSKKFDHRG